jgi:hypothetical protein
MKPVFPPNVDASDFNPPNSEQTSFFCDLTAEPWITEKGWVNLL